MLLPLRLITHHFDSNSRAFPDVLISIYAPRDPRFVALGLEGKPSLFTQKGKEYHAPAS
jgi:hypothetical protein